MLSKKDEDLVDEAFRMLVSFFSTIPGPDCTFPGAYSGDAIALLIDVGFVRRMGLGIQLTQAGWSFFHDRETAKLALREHLSPPLRPWRARKLGDAGKAAIDEGLTPAQTVKQKPAALPAAEQKPFQKKHVLIPVKEPLAPAKRKTKRPPAKKERLRAVLFLDVKGFSDLEERKLKHFVAKVLKRIKPILRKHNGTCSNTWGDAVVSVFPTTQQAALAALAIRDIFKKPDKVLGQLSCRSAINTRDVQVLKNPITNRSDVFGKGVNMAARLEPHVEPGYVYSFTECEGEGLACYELPGIVLRKTTGNPVRPFVVVREKEDDPRPLLRKGESLIKAMLQDWIGTDGKGRRTLTATYANVDETINLVPGSARKYLPLLAVEAGLMIEMRDADSFALKYGGGVKP